MSNEIMERLKAPFPEDDIEWRLQSCGEKSNGEFWGMALAYVTNRAIMNRLDEVFGIFNWKNEFEKSPNGGTLCGISVKIGDEWVTKWDGADDTQMEAVKGGLSGAMKRAAVQWGIGRYLYNLQENWAVISEKGKLKGKTKNNKTFKWDPPALPAWAKPKDTKQEKKEPVEPKKKKMSPEKRTLAEKMQKEDAEKRVVSKEIVQLFKNSTEKQKTAIEAIKAGRESKDLSLEELKSIKALLEA